MATLQPGTRAYIEAEIACIDLAGLGCFHPAHVSTAKDILVSFLLSSDNDNLVCFQRHLEGKELLATALSRIVELRKRRPDLLNTPLATQSVSPPSPTLTLISSQSVPNLPANSVLFQGSVSGTLIPNVSPANSYPPAQEVVTKPPSPPRVNNSFADQGSKWIQDPEMVRELNNFINENYVRTTESRIGIKWTQMAKHFGEYLKSKGIERKSKVNWNEKYTTFCNACGITFWRENNGTGYVYFVGLVPKPK